jgi:SAM-dependent methyltransferase
MEPMTCLSEISRRGGPNGEEYDLVADCFAAIARGFEAGRWTRQELDAFAYSLGDAFSLQTIQGFVLRKPYGYAGDFEVIERLYLNYISSDNRLKKWDLFALSRRSNQAVRNRKAYFIRFLKDRTRTPSPRGGYRVLSVGSGPCREVSEFLDAHSDRGVRFDCLDREPRASEYAKTVCSRHLGRISFVTMDIFRFRSSETFDFIWSAGLFDYLEDRVFRLLLRRLWPRLAPGGELVVGNFSPKNPDKDYMTFGGWTLIHRTSEQLMALVSDSGLSNSSARVDCEEEGINLFLHITKNAALFQGGGDKVIR